MPHFRLTLLALLLTSFSCLYGQDSTRNGIVLLAWPPEFYLSDAETEIMAQTQRTPDEYRAYFRKALDLKLSAALESLAPVYSVLQDSTAKQELERFYNGNAYTYLEPVGPRPKDSKETPSRGPLPHFKNRQTAQMSLSGHADARCMQVEIRDRDGYNLLLQKNKAGLVLCINQFEIRTNYNSCLDIARKVYRREILLHYSIHDRNGKVLRSNFASAYFPSDSNRDSDIAERVFPELAGIMAAAIRPLAGQ